jgi:hypothetical protein
LHTIDATSVATAEDQNRIAACHGGCYAQTEA